MPVRVLIVDDSVFFRNRISQMLREHPDIQIVDTAKNGAEAVAKVKQLRPDVVTMDVEMPEMDGITALKQIMVEAPCQVLMLSSLTRRSASVTIEALEYGAADYLEKDARKWVSDEENVSSTLTEKVLALGAASGCRKPRPAHAPAAGSGFNTRVTSQRHAKAAAPSSPASSQSLTAQPPCRILAIGSSTGGPAALQAILPEIKPGFPVPVLLTQHMPKTFTSVFAKRLNELCQVPVKEAEDGDRLQAGHIYLAPGGMQMILDPADPNRLKICESDERINYKPSVDLTFASVARGFGSRVLAIVLTGMGSDGCDGARVLKKSGATVWAQDKDSCTIFGMPKAVISAELADEVMNLSEMKTMLERWRK